MQEPGLWKGQPYQILAGTAAKGVLLHEFQKNSNKDELEHCWQKGFTEISP